MFRFIQDDDAHWYLIPEKKTDEFEQWVYSQISMEENELIFTDFDSMRVTHPSHYVIKDYERR